MSAIRDLAAFVCGASVTSLPEAERAIQRRHAADTLLAAAVGAWTGEGRELRYVMSASSLADAIGTQAAREGVGGDPDLLDGPWLRDAHGLNADPNALTANLGRGSIYAQLSLKP